MPTAWLSTQQTNTVLLQRPFLWEHEIINCASEGRSRRMQSHLLCNTTHCPNIIGVLGSLVSPQNVSRFLFQPLSNQFFLPSLFIPHSLWGVLIPTRDWRLLLEVKSLSSQEVKESQGWEQECCWHNSPAWLQQMCVGLERTESTGKPQNPSQCICRVVWILR